ncbi:MAG: NAD(P)H-dependent oxidoreductase subunit E [Clostridiales bacterium]|nr:NAD(P)H-dependent oxidoreductase subunit E [Clostridiales bacterium]
MDKSMKDAVQKIVIKHGVGKEFLLPILKEVQKLNKYHYIPQDVSQYMAKYMGIHESEVYEVISFYAEFSEVPRGENVIKVCDSTVCKVNDNEELIGLLEDVLGIGMGETSENKKFSLEFSPCFGACDIAPAIRINGEVFGNLNKERLEEILQYYKEGPHEKNS